MQMYNISRMGYGYYEPRVVYGFYEEDQTKLISGDFLEEHDIELYFRYANKGGGFGFIYGISCSLEETSKIDKAKVDKVFELVSDKGKYVYVAPKFMLGLIGDHNTDYDRYDP